MTNKIILSVVVLNFNGARWIKKNLDSLILSKKENKTIEIIFVDNFSNDSSLEVVKEYKKEINILALEKNFGYSKANNKASQIAKGKYILFLNNDTFVEEDFFSKNLSYIKSNDPDIFGVRIMNYDKSKIKEKDFLSIDIFGYPIPSDKKVFYIDGSSLFIKKQIFLKLNGFDNDYFIFAEDIDICWRARNYGYKITINKDSEIYHYMGGTIEGSSNKSEIHETSYFRRFNTEKNTISNLIKNYPTYLSFFLFLILIIIYLFESIYIVITNRSFDPVKQIYFRAVKENLLNLKKTLIKKKKSTGPTSFIKLLKNIEFMKLYKIIILLKIKKTKLINK